MRKTNTANGKKLVIVESPSKARTIGVYLGPEYLVTSSNGHVRGLPARSGAVEPDRDFFIHYEIPEKSKRQVDVIKRALVGGKCKQLYVATDPDREGEAIGWHIVEILKDQHVIDHNVDVKRISFNAITKNDVRKAVDEPREIDMNLVNAQQARCSLDYLIGFNVSPILWHKLPGSRSAGRVQSVALRMICDRESEIDHFMPQEYWTIDISFISLGNDDAVVAQLITIDGKKLEKFDIANGEQAAAIVSELRSREYKIADIKKQITSRNPSPPFITSTLQQDASRNLGFSPSRTMRAAQRLYEGVSLDGGEVVGLITYMRTDGLYVAEEAIEMTRDLIKNKFGTEYIPPKKRSYNKKVKNSQEAHEAIRPTDVRRTPDMVSGGLDSDTGKLYELIWRRMVASQMESAKYERLTASIASQDDKYGLRASGSTLIFDGFLKLSEDRTDSSQKISFTADDKILAKNLIDKQHFTEPPPRFSEASLIANMEELGIGRPSTYASIIHVLQDRLYVDNRNHTFFPTARGRIVAAFLKNFFAKYVEYGFTSSLEEDLDAIANGTTEWKQVLNTFWRDFASNVSEVKNTTRDDIMLTLTKHIDYLTAKHVDEGCPQCKEGHLRLQVSRHGPYMGCSRYPECTYSQDMSSGESDGSTAEQYPKVLGVDPESGKEVSIRRGPYGLYVQVGEVDKSEKKIKTTRTKTAKTKDETTPGAKPTTTKTSVKRSSLPKGVSPDNIDLKKALKLLSLPTVIGVHPDTGLEIKVGISMFGPYVHYSGQYVSINNKYDFLEITLSEAMEIISNSRKLKESKADDKAIRSASTKPKVIKRAPAGRKPTAKTAPKSTVRSRAKPKSVTSKKLKNQI